MRPITILCIAAGSALLLCVGIGTESMPMVAYGAMGFGYALGALSGCREN